MKIGFIGCGNIAGAMIGSIIKEGVCKPSDIIGSDMYPPSLEETKRTYGIRTALKNVDVVKNSEVIFLTIKPQFYEIVIKEIKPMITPKHLIITVAPGKTLDWVGELIGKKIPVIRSMPNTPAMVGEGITAISPNDSVTKKMYDSAVKILNCFGKTEKISEHLMDAVVAVSGSSPAYVFILIESMADAAVAEGMPRKQAYTFAAQAVLGSAKMVLDTNMHPGELKDRICSPAGTTIEAVYVLEKNKFRSTIMQAMKACADKAREL